MAGLISGVPWSPWRTSHQRVGPGVGKKIPGVGARARCNESSAVGDGGGPRNADMARRKRERRGRSDRRSEKWGKIAALGAGELRYSGGRARAACVRAVCSLCSCLFSSITHNNVQPRLHHNTPAALHSVPSSPDPQHDIISGERPFSPSSCSRFHLPISSIYRRPDCRLSSYTLLNVRRFLRPRLEYRSPYRIEL